MNIFSLMISLLLFFQLSECTLSPPKDRNNKKNKGKIENKVKKIISHNNYDSFLIILFQKGPVEQDVFSRILVVKNPKTHDIIRESGFYFFNTTRRRFSGEVLGYITPVNLLIFLIF